MLSAVVLAAGLSGRMKGINKLLLDYRGKTILETTIDSIIASGMEEIVVVIGHQAEETELILRDLPVKTVFNPAYKEGITSSIQAGILSASGNGYMICLSDMVSITAEEYKMLNTAFTNRIQMDPKCICVPAYNGERGNPVIFSSNYREEILNHQSMDGCKRIVQSHSDYVCLIEMPTSHILEDVDYREDYENLEE